MTGEARKEKISFLQKSLKGQQSVFAKKVKEYDASLKTSFLISQILAKRLKPYSDGEVVKECLCVASDNMFPDKKKLVENISLSRYTVARRKDSLSGNIESTMAKRVSAFSSYSVALDESCDTTDTAQLAVYSRGVDNDYNITEEMASLQSMKGTTTGQTIFDELEKVLSRFGLDYTNLVSITTDGAPAMSGQRNGVVGLLKTRMGSQNIDSGSLIVLHCIVHQEALCAKTINFEHVTNILVKAVNFIRSRGLNHHEFQQLMADIDAEYSDVKYFCEVRWLSKAGMLKRAYDLLEEIALFLDMKGNAIPELRNKEWRCDLAFLVDITDHLSVLNVRLQGKRSTNK
ncbi:general transcription factor II-I repeat domain-containing protein 2A-like [Macrobrachium rosenbergii]|uniref:general transcription factor II-I repeat domain-containing protein 2A-like n=1 Tax=Macrobrachium rosenbergii TaxID=79674 RepID=UPI0034D6678B